MSAWWRRDKSVRRLATDAELDISLRAPDEGSDPPQAESLFDGDVYSHDWDARLAAEVGGEIDGGSESPSESMFAAEPEPEQEPPPQPEASAEPASGPPSMRDRVRERGLAPEAGFAPGIDPDPESRMPGSETVDAVDDPRTTHARHVRRRKAGRPRKASAPAPDTESPESEGGSPVPVTGIDDGAGSQMRGPGRLRPSIGRARTALAGAGSRVLGVLLIIAVLMGSLYGLTVGVNALARWNARRVAAMNAAPASPTEDNLLVIGVTDGVAVGFTALKVERPSHRVLGIAIPDGAFVEVPGQGFERIGVSFAGGPEVSKDTVSNYLGVPFRSYVVIDGAAYQSLLKDQSVSAVMAHATATDLTPAKRAAFAEYFASVNTKDVWIVPLPVKPVAVGDQRYFEPQRAQVADLLLQWWGVQASQQKATPRVIVYNGVGTPGIAGLAAQQLIRAGLRVVDSGNADNFKHATTLILVYHGTQADADLVRSTLGVGQILVQSASQDLADMIVIVGADYRPPTSDISTTPTSTVTTEGVQ